MKVRKLLLCVLSIVFILLFVNTSLPVNSIAASSPIVNNGIYYIKNKRTGKYLTASSTSAGASLTMGNYSGSSLQRFKLVLAETSGSISYYNIILNAASNLRLDVCNAWDADGNTIGLFQNNPSYSQAQRFHFIQVTPNYGQSAYRIMPKLSTTRVFSVTSQLTPGNSIMLYGTSSTYNQEWILERTTLEMSIASNIRINQQETGTTCGCACVRNILSNFGIIKSEGTIKSHAMSVAAQDPASDYTYVWVLTQTLNDFLSAGNTGIHYTYVYTHNYSLTDYALVLGVHLSFAMPIMFNGNFSSNNYVPYNSSGHYVVCSGIKSPANTTDYTAIISDPYKVGTKTYAGIWEMPLSELRSTNRNHSSGGYMIAADSAN